MKIDIEIKTYAHRIEQNQRKRFNTEPRKALKMCAEELEYLYKQNRC